MDKYLNNDEERLFELLESKDPDQLTEEELAFVQQRMTLSNYALQRRMINEAGEVYPAAPQAKPLVIAPSGNRFTRKTVPLYQAITAVAATIALFLSLWPGDAQPQTPTAGKGTQTSHVDTVIQTQIVVDTVFRYIQAQEKHLAQPSNDTKADGVIRANQVRMLESGPISLPELTEELVRTKGSSMKDDSASRAILSSVYQSTIW